ncbi:hypothetical protein QBC44DRAFT_306368 [Cladorrhinum sp. PSN332]|nr:hypothetical protein QBC44DRAFT_306368 [Cladorrhinum sp. PSN332]
MALTVDEILRASDDDLRAAIRAICADDSDVRDRLATYLHKVQNPTIPPKAVSKSAKSAIGTIKVNEEEWQDTYDEADPDYDDPEMRKSYPEGYLFDCCGEIGDHPGCKTGRHKTEETLSKELSEPVVKKEVFPMNSGHQQRIGRLQSSGHQSINKSPTPASHQSSTAQTTQQQLIQQLTQFPTQSQPQPHPHSHQPAATHANYPSPYQPEHHQQPLYQQTPQHPHPYPPQPNNQQPQWVEPRAVQQPGPARPGFRYVNPFPGQAYPAAQPQPPPGYQWQLYEEASLNLQPQDVNHNKRRRV